MCFSPFNLYTFKSSRTQLGQIRLVGPQFRISFGHLISVFLGSCFRDGLPSAEAQKLGVHTIRICPSEIQQELLPAWLMSRSPV